ncbi:MAG TPA: DUF1501 domain-containing protein [Candidatus Saccharimonadales bacterium]|nr:DUF1501 domain-containing protein [Candidatus Saccharimonadales bacterium]
MANIITRRAFMKAGLKATAVAGLASLTQIPPFLRQALAEGQIGISGKKVLFIFMRGGNDGVNNIIPIQDPAYAANRTVLGLPKDPMALYSETTGTADIPAANYPYAINLRNGFAALNPAMADMVPLYNSRDLALIHRVAYRSQSRSHFDSEQYWEKGADGSTGPKTHDGLWYRTIIESGWNKNHALSGVSIQSNMPASLRGAYPLTNLSSINRYNLLGVYNPSNTSTNADRLKLLNAIDQANLQAYPAKDNRDMVFGLGTAFRDTLDIFQDPAFATNEFYDSNGTTHLFPIGSSSDQRGLGNGAYGFFQSVKSAAQVLANTDAIITGTEIGGFDTHTSQVTVGSPHLGGHASLLRRVAWAFYALKQYFSNPAYNIKGKNMWNDVVIVTMSEFGRTSAENASVGTDHAEASVMYVAGGSVTGGVYGCDLNAKNGVANWTPSDGINLKSGSLFAANNSVGYLKRVVDYRSVVGEIIRDHLGATQAQLNRIIPGYGIESTEHLLNGISSGSTPLIGELGLV